MKLLKFHAVSKETSNISLVQQVISHECRMITYAWKKFVLVS